MTMTRLEAFVRCLLALGLTASGIEMLSVLVAMTLAVDARWMGAAIIGVFGSVRGRC
jgi:hypothetical protein